MNKKILLAIFILFTGFVIVLYFSFFRNEKIMNYPSSGTDIIAFGDSLIEGVGASAPDKNFISILSSKINKPIINLGVSGNTTADGITRLSELDAYKPRVVILLLGGNDHLKKVPISETFKNLSVIIENLQSRGAVVLLLGVRGNLIGDKFKPEFKKIQSKYETAYVEDVLSGLFGNTKYMSDAVHPNDLGYAKIAERVFPILNKLVR